MDWEYFLADQGSSIQAAHNLETSQPDSPEERNKSDNMDPKSEPAMAVDEEKWQKILEEPKRSEIKDCVPRAEELMKKIQSLNSDVLDFLTDVVKSLPSKKPTTGETLRRLFWLPSPAAEGPQLSHIFHEPWRKLLWGNNQQDLQYVQHYKPINEYVRHLRVLLYGPVGAGRSSFINSVSFVMRRRMTIPASVSITKSFTTRYQTHRIQIGRGAHQTFYPVVFNDIMGLEEGTNSGILPEDVILAMKGHILDGYRFNPDCPLSEGDHHYNPDPAPDDKVHVLVCVLSANIAELKESLLRKMNSVRQTAADLGIPQIAIITNIDAACPETEKDLKNVYRTTYLQNKMKKFSSALGIPLNYIFPVKNYSHEIDLDDDIDTLILCALKNMINFGDNFVETNVPL